MWFFFGQAFCEPHSTRPVEDTVGWGLDTVAEVLTADVRGSLGQPGRPTLETWCVQVSCPTLVINGADDLVVGDESWDIDYFWHENPELKRATYARFTDLVGFLPMGDDELGPVAGSAIDPKERDAPVAADVNAEMIEHIARFPNVRELDLRRRPR